MIEGSGGEEEKGRGGRGRGEGKRNYDVYFCNIYIYNRWQPYHRRPQ